MHGNGIPPAYPELASAIARTGRSLTDLAKEIGIHPNTLSHVIRGRMRPSVALRQRIADCLAVDDVDYLFQLSPEVERIIQMRVEQGLGRSVTDPETLRRIAVLTTPHK